jgi:hypothetical protein
MLKPRLHKILKMYGAKIVSNLQRELRINDNIATGKAIESLKSVVFSDVTMGRSNVVLNIVGLNYINALDTGTAPASRKGRKSRYKSIEQWIRAKSNFKLRDRSGRFLPKTERNIKRAAFSISRSIGQKGIRPYNLLEYAFVPEERKIVADVVVAFIEEELNKIIKDKQ